MPVIFDSVAYVDTNRDAHFTDALIQNASEYENLTVTGTGPLKCHVTQIRLTTATRHDWTVAFYSRDVFHERLAATPYANALISMVHLDAAGAWATASEYVYATDFPAIQYMDEDGTGELHVGLHNRDSKTKAALGASLPAGVPVQYLVLRFGIIAAT